MADHLLMLLKSGQRYALSTIPSRLLAECSSIYSTFIDTNIEYKKWIWTQYSLQLWNKFLDCNWMSIPSRIFRPNKSTYWESRSDKQLRLSAYILSPLIILKWWMIPIYVYCFPSTSYYHVTPEFLGTKLSAYAEYTKTIAQIEGYTTLKAAIAKTKTEVLEDLCYKSLISIAKIFRKQCIQTSLVYQKAYLPFIYFTDYKRLPSMRSKIMEMFNDIRKEDQLLENENEDIDSYSIWKLQQIVSDRGMIVYQSSREDMINYLKQWLTISRSDNPEAMQFILYAAQHQNI